MQYGSSTNTTPGNFHIYAVEWNPQSINWYVDNTLYVTGNITNNINNTGAFQNSFYVILNLAIGGTLSGSTVDNSSLPTTMLVDYVHAYNITNAAPPVGQTITLKGSNGLYITSNNADSAMACNRATAQGWEQFRWISDPDGTISLQGSNGDYVSSENGQTFMTCTRTRAQGWEEFRVNQ